MTKLYCYYLIQINIPPDANNITNIDTITTLRSLMEK